MGRARWRRGDTHDGMFITLLTTAIVPSLCCCCCSYSCFALTSSSFSSSQQPPAPPVSSFLAKTTETFKIADLQFLEARIQLGGERCERILVDSSTGSCLLKFTADELVANDCESDGVVPHIPSSIRRCDWVGEILAHGADATCLLNAIRQKVEERDQAFVFAGWVMDYKRMKDAVEADTNDARRGKDSDGGCSHTAKTLLCCISQTIPSPASLSPLDATQKLLVVDAGRRCGVFLLRITELSSPDLRPPVNEARIFKKLWARRPFQYSSAINPSVAEILVDLLRDMVRRRRKQRSGISEDDEPAISILDPTCGSGTFLAFALSRGMRADGWDVNPRCVDGTSRNLRHVFGDDVVADKCRIQIRDATLRRVEDEPLECDCVVANLPWGQNTISYRDECRGILEALRTSLRPETPCAFVSKSDGAVHEMRRLGFCIVGVAHVPQLNFRLPKGNKKSKKFGDVVVDGQPTSSRDRGNSCMITVALSPEWQ